MIGLCSRPIGSAMVECTDEVVESPPRSILALSNFRIAAVCRPGAANVNGAVVRASASPYRKGAALTNPTNMSKPDPHQPAPLGKATTLANDDTPTPEPPSSGEPGPGHNNPFADVVWERKTKHRIFVRALEGTYGNLVHELYSQPRVYRTKDLKWKGGPGSYGKKVINPQAVKVAQSIETHMEVYAPGGRTSKHGHMNSAVFFVLKGKGHDVHDRRRYDWEAGDAMIVENACVHQHFSDETDDECILLVMKAKPLFLFMHMLFQKVAEFPSKDPTPKQLTFVPPGDL
jgi:quercetin dioxygenase-like cupin family protein